MNLCRALLLLCCCVPAWLCAAPNRVVSLAPSVTELILELGAQAQLVGLVDGGIRHPELAYLPSLGNHAQRNMELLLSLKPDLVIAWGDALSDAEHLQLKAADIPLVVVAPHDLTALSQIFVSLGEALGRAAEGHALSTAFNERIAALRVRYQRTPPVSVFYQVWDTPLYTLGGGHIINDALAVCGARNVFVQLRIPAPQVSLEAVLQANPSVILLSEARQADAWLAWKQLHAVRQAQVWSIPSPALERPSYAMLDAIEALCRQLAQAH